MIGVTGQGVTMREGTERRNILHGRHENSTIHDEIGMRHYYSAWGDMLGVHPESVSSMMESTFGIPLSDNKVSVNADLTGKQKRYIQIRMEQLAEEREKCHDDHDKMWFTRCIQELEWVLQMKDKPTHNCYMQSNTQHKT